jgi:hypothetical protein
MKMMVEWFRDVNNRVLVWAMVTVVAITSNLVSTTVLMSYVLNSEDRVQARMGRLASTITRTQNALHRELSIAADDLDSLLYINRYPWTRNNMLDFCIEAQRINKDFRCPDIIALSPELFLLQKRGLADVKRPIEPAPDGE